MEKTFAKIKGFIAGLKELFAKIGETGFLQAILKALSGILDIEKEGEAKEIIDDIAGTIE